MIETTPTTTSSQSKPRVRRGSKPYIFHIESKTRPGRFHVVDAHRLTCTCEAGRAGRGCWHLRLALAAYDWVKRQQAQARAQAATPASAPVPPAPAPVPHAPAGEGDWHTSTAYRGLAAAFE